MENENDFFSYSIELVNSYSRRLRIDFQNCKRIWPSAVTLLCSLNQWIKHTQEKSSKPIVESTKPNDELVSAYLKDCGFYAYVGRYSDSTDTKHPSDSMVKIDHIFTKNKLKIDRIIEDKETQILNIIRKYTKMSDFSIMIIDRNILSEIFNNLTEHGIPFSDAGWWVIAQYHERTGIITVCFADNGIGFKHSIMSGPQSNYVAEKLQQYDNDGDIIAYAFENNVSGSLSASHPEFARGARKGQGLSRIREACRELHISVRVLSHRGYVCLDSSGEIVRKKTYDKRIFAGTMYQLTINVNEEV